MFSTLFYGRGILGIFVKHIVIWSIRNLDTEIKPNKFYFYKNFRPSDMREEISKLPSSIQSFANVFQLLLNFVMMVIILNFIISIICDVEKEVRIGNKSKDWLNYLYSKGRFDIFIPHLTIPYSVFFSIFCWSYKAVQNCWEFC